MGNDAVNPEILCSTGDKINLTKTHFSQQNWKCAARLASVIGLPRSLTDDTREAIKHPTTSFLKLSESFSGVRAVAGSGPVVEPALKVIVGTFGYAYLLDLIQRHNNSKKEISLVLGRETRPTGEVIASLLASSFGGCAQDNNMSIKLFDLGITTTPLFESAIRTLKADGGVMVTASHNELFWNGMKFSTGYDEPNNDFLNRRGALLSPAKMERVISIASGLREDVAAIPIIEEGTGLNSGSSVVLTKDGETLQDRIFEAYLEEIMGLFKITSEELQELRKTCAHIKVVVDPNGGGACKIARPVLEFFGFGVLETNAEPGVFVHRIEPIKEALYDARKLLEGSKAAIAAIYDADADRALTEILNELGQSQELHPQTVTALNVACMLSWVEAHKDRYPEAKNRKWAVVAHDATSYKTEAICRLFGAEVHYVDVGEINVVSKMEELESKGYFVPIGVEGYSGGTVLRGSTVRDGTVTVLLNLLVSTDQKCKDCLHNKLATRETQRPPATLNDIKSLIPKRHIIQRKLVGAVLEESINPLDLIEKNVITQLNTNGEAFCDTVVGKVISFDNNMTLDGLTNLRFSKLEIEKRGGIKFIFSSDNEEKHFLWFRASKTEQGVIRSCVDSENEDVATELDSYADRLYGCLSAGA